MAFLKAGRDGRLSGADWYRRAVWLLPLLLAFSSLESRSETTTPSAEYQVEAAFLFNFAQFVQWPAASFRDRKAPLIIGVVGDDPFGPYVDKLTLGEKIEDHPIELRRYRRSDDFTTCHILFISRSESGQLDKILAKLRGHSVLTVSDAENFSRRGGMIRFVTEKGKIRLRVNVIEAKASELTISSKLLRLAKIVTPERD